MYIARVQSDHEVDLNAVKGRLKGLRARLCLSQLEVAVALGVKYRTFQSWEDGVHKTTSANYEKLANFYSKKLGQAITRDWLLFGEDAPAFPRTKPGTFEQLKQEMAERIDALGVTLRAELLAELEQYSQPTS